VKITVEMPDDLMIQVKVEAARDRQKLKEILPELVGAGLEARRKRQASAESFSAKDWLAAWQALGAEIERGSVDPRSLVEILDQDRR